MILTGDEIVAARKRGEIEIEPFDNRLLNPNSYNYRLGPRLLTHKGGVVDSRTTSRDDWLEVLPTGGAFHLPARELFLGATMEVIGSECYVPVLIGRSSMGRLGLFLEVTAELGHVGTSHCWTLELTCVQSLTLYVGMRIGQVSFWKPDGELDPYKGEFGMHSQPMPTMGWDCTL